MLTRHFKLLSSISLAVSFLWFSVAPVQAADGKEKDIYEVIVELNKKLGKLSESVESLEKEVIKLRDSLGREQLEGQAGSSEGYISIAPDYGTGGNPCSLSEWGLGCDQHIFDAIVVYCKNTDNCSPPKTQHNFETTPDIVKFFSEGRMSIDPALYPGITIQGWTTPGLNRQGD